jgi:hypothetical protein
LTAAEGKLSKVHMPSSACAGQARKHASIAIFMIRMLSTTRIALIWGAGDGVLKEVESFGR